MCVVYTVCMKKRYTYKLRPGKTAQRSLVQQYGTCRWIWNQCVEVFNKYEPTGQTTLMKQVTTWRKEHTWLSDQPVVPQQQVIRDFISAKKAFFDKIRKTPRFKSRRQSHPSLSYTKRGFTITDSGRLKLAGKIVIPVVWSRDLPENPSSVRVFKDPCGDWWASFVVEMQQNPKPRNSDGQIGIDWGVKTPATGSRPGFDMGYTPRVKDNAKNLAKYQRRMARHKAKQEWESYRKTKKKKAKLERRVKRQRKEQSRKWAQHVARNNKTVAIEDFKPKFLFKKKYMAKKSADIAIGIAKNELISACQTFGSDLYVIDPYYTTMDCSNCGTRAKTKLDLGVRTFQCSTCNTVLDRDVNAARNMLLRAGFNPTVDEDLNPTSLSGCR